MRRLRAQGDQKLVVRQRRAAKKRMDRYRSDAAWRARFNAIRRARYWSLSEAERHAKAKANYWKDPEKHKAQRRDYYRRHAEKMYQASLIYRRKHRQRWLSWMRRSARKAYYANPEKFRQRARLYSQKHPVARRRSNIRRYFPKGTDLTSGLYELLAARREWTTRHSSSEYMGALATAVEREIRSMRGKVTAKRVAIELCLTETDTKKALAALVSTGVVAKTGRTSSTSYLVNREANK